MIMKTKNIFLTVAAALFMFAACSEEKIIDEPGVSGKGDLVIELSPSSVITKAAATNEGYVYATGDELNVDDCWIFVFDKNDQYIASQYFNTLSDADDNYVDNPGPNGGSQTYKKGYKVTMSNLDYATYRFWVVANPNSADYVSCKTLSGLKSIVEGAGTYKAAFEERATKLVKVGDKEATFDKSSGSIQIPLTQLAARVELKVRVDIPRQLLGGEYEYPDLTGVENGVLTADQIDELTGTHERDKSINNTKLQEKDGDNNLLYTYFGHPVKITSKQEPKCIWVNNQLKVIKNTKYSGYLLDEIKLTVDDIRIKSQLEPLAVVDGQLDDNVFDPLEGTVSTTYLFKFYTYTKEDLTISLTGNLQKATYSVSQSGTLENCVFVNDKDLALVKRINSGEIQDDEVLSFGGGSGWSGATGVLLCNEKAWVAVGEAIEGKPSYEGSSKSYSSGSVALKPTDGFKVGNMYEASILIQSVPIDGSLNVVIEGIKEFADDIKFGFE